MGFRKVGFIFVLVLQTALLHAQDKYALVRLLMSDDSKQRKQAFEQVIEARDHSLVPAMVDALFYTPKKNRNDLVKALRSYTGEKAGNDYYEWVEVIGRRSEFRPAEDYLQWKVSLLSRIDPAYRKILYPAIPSRIRPEEIVWGGVKFDGIPTLQHPSHVQAADAGFMQDDEKVFALELNGQSRAYPLRVLSWHEMTNDIVGGEPITISF